MINIKELIDFDRPAADIISDLRDRSVYVPKWSALVNMYEPNLHRVMTDNTVLKDKVRKDGSVEKSARIAIGLEKLLSNRFTEFTFSIPVKRDYSMNEKDDTRLEITKAIEKIYDVAHIDTENMKRGLAYYAACEIFTMWYTVKKKNNLYGFPCEYKLKCKTYSPMDGVLLYPLLDELDDMIAMSFEYSKKVGKDRITYFETYTADRHYVWEQTTTNSSWKQMLTSRQDTDGEIVNGEEISIMKIPGVYAWRRAPVYEDLSVYRREIEYTLSRNSNVLGYNSAPLLKVAGAMKGQERKDESYRLWRVENGGDVSYVSWQQSIEALKYHVDMMISLFFRQAQMPDISFEKMANLGNIGYDARQTLFMDAHLKIGNEARAWREFLDREFNVVKAFLKLMNKKWSEEMIDSIRCTNIITPFVQNSKSAEIEMRIKANGGKPLESHLESIQKFGESSDPAATLEMIRKEEKEESDRKANEFSMNNSMF